MLGVPRVGNPSPTRSCRSGTCRSPSLRFEFSPKSVKPQRPSFMTDVTENGNCSGLGPTSLGEITM